MGEMGKRLALALLITVFVLGALLGLNLAFVEVITGPTRWAALPLATASALLAAAAGAWFASVRSGRQVTATLVGTVLVCLVGAGYATHLVTMSVHRFGAAVVAPQGVVDENYARRGKHVYYVNSFGFRGPEWSTAKSPDTVRGVVIGDSMVFGSGVDDGDTIDAALVDRLHRAHPSTPVEVLNLGVVGSNLPNYVELYRAAEQRLSADFTVLFLFLPNDLGELEQPSQHGRLGAYSFFEFLLGNNNNLYTFYTTRWSEARSEVSKLGFLAHHIEEIEQIRRSPLFIFFYHDENPAWIDTVRARLRTGATIVDHPPLPDDDFIAGDGHPTAAGNRHFAELIGNAIDRAPSLHQRWSAG